MREDGRTVRNMAEYKCLVGTFSDGVGNALPALGRSLELGTHAFAVFVDVHLGENHLVTREDRVAHLDERRLVVAHDVDAVFGRRFFV